MTTYNIRVILNDALDVAESIRAEYRGTLCRSANPGVPGLKPGKVGSIQWPKNQTEVKTVIRGAKSAKAGKRLECSEKTAYVPRNGYRIQGIERMRFLFPWTMVTMKIRVNGEEKDTRQRTVAGLLEEMGVATGGVAVELNTKVLKRADLGQTPLGENDVLEIINFVGGG